MSGTQRPAPQRRELEIMRVLFERRLKERAIALADSRWPGSGKMVDLAYEWGQLNPEQRREELSKIGPEEIARLRQFAELNPSLAAAITELDRRGALPHIEAAAVDIAAASREAREPASPADAPTADSVAAPEPTPEAAVATEIEAETIDTSHGPTYAEPEPVAELPYTIASPSYGFENSDISTLNTDMPSLDLGLPTTTEFLESQTQQREDSARATEESMERVRQRLEQSAQRAFDRGSAFAMPKLPDISRPTLPTTAPAPAPARQDGPRAIAAPRALAQELAARVVATLRPGDALPSDDELVALANDLQISLSEHEITFDNRKAEFGGLVNEGGRISVQPGRLAHAVAGPNLVVVRGRMTAQLAERLAEGFLDIPGTRASVRLHPRTRILLVGS